MRIHTTICLRLRFTLTTCTNAGERPSSVEYIYSVYPGKRESAVCDIHTILPSLTETRNDPNRLDHSQCRSHI